MADLKTQLAVACALVEQLKNQLAAANKNSTNSSKRPSSDIVKPKPPSDDSATKRTIGAQPGHSRHEGQPFPPEEVTAFVPHHTHNCPHCGDTLQPLIRPEIRSVQQVDIRDIRLDYLS